MRATGRSRAPACTVTRQPQDGPKHQSALSPDSQRTFPNASLHCHRTATGRSQSLACGLHCDRTGRSQTLACTVTGQPQNDPKRQPAQSQDSHRTIPSASLHCHRTAAGRSQTLACSLHCHRTATGRSHAPACTVTGQPKDGPKH